jgi:hypothetical protein
VHATVRRDADEDRVERGEVVRREQHAALARNPLDSVEDTAARQAREDRRGEDAREPARPRRIATPEPIWREPANHPALARRSDGVDERDLARFRHDNAL